MSAIHPSRTEHPLVRHALIAIVIGFMALFLFLPVACIFSSAFDKGVAFYFAAIRTPEALSAIRLTLLTSAIAVAPA